MPNCYLCKKAKRERTAKLAFIDPPVCRSCLICPNCGQPLTSLDNCNLCCVEFASGEVVSFYRDHYESIPMIFYGANARVNVRALGYLVEENLEEIKGCLWLAETIKQVGQPCVDPADQEFLAYIGGTVNIGELLNPRQEERLHAIKDSLRTLWPLWQASEERQELLAKLKAASKHYKPFKIA